MPVPPGLSPSPVGESTQEVTTSSGVPPAADNLAPPNLGNGGVSSPSVTAAPSGQQSSAHAESSRSAAGFASPAPAQGVMGNLMQSFDVAKEICESPHERSEARSDAQRSDVATMSMN